MRVMKERFEIALERSRTYARLAQGFWRPKDLSSGSSPEGAGGKSAEYDRLFAHRTTVLCPIYEVEYDRDRAVSQGATLADIAGFYRAFGLELAVNERPDHLALELEFMGFLAHKEALALQDGLLEQAELCRDAQKKFLEAHLGRWVGIVADTLARATQIEFYKTLAADMKEFIESECALLRVQPEIITARPPEAETTDVRCPAVRS